MYTDGGSEDRHWLSQDVQLRSPTHRSRDAKGWGTIIATICTEPGNVCHSITTRATPERQMKETLYTRHRNTVEPMMVKNDRNVCADCGTTPHDVKQAVQQTIMKK